VVTAMKKAKAKGYKWQPLERACGLMPADEELIQAHMNELSLNRDGAPAFMEKDEGRVEYWINDLYQIKVRRYPSQVAPGTPHGSPEYPTTRW
jgi:hypothetical protein